MNNDSGTIQPELLGVSEILKMLNIGRTSFYSLCASGKFAPLPVNLCRKVLYRRAEIEAWLAAECPHRRQWQNIKGQR